MVGCGGDPQPVALALQDPDGVLTVIAGTFDRSCAEAKSVILQCGRWELAVHLKPAAQSGGPKPLASDDTWAEDLQSDGRPDGKQCTILGGTFEQGTIEITNAAAATVAFTIAGTTKGTFDADGVYEAARCQ
jgi:hypothetical protein